VGNVRPWLGRVPKAVMAYAWHYFRANGERTHGARKESL
jgi:hypothetical protein